MTIEELKQIIEPFYGFVHYNKGLRVWQVIVDDIDIWLTEEDIKLLDEKMLGTIIAKTLIQDLASGKKQKDIYLN